MSSVFHSSISVADITLPLFEICHKEVRQLRLLDCVHTSLNVSKIYAADVVEILHLSLGESLSNLPKYIHFHVSMSGYINAAADSTSVCG